MRRLMAVATTALLATASLGLAQSQRIAPRVSPPVLKEDLGPTPVSQPVVDMADAVYGLMANTPTALVDFPATSGIGDPAFFVHGVGGAQKQLCVSIKRAQAGYRADFTTRAPAGRGLVKIPFDSSAAARKQMRAARPSAIELAVRVTEPRGGKCLAKAPIFPASWQASAASEWVLLVGGRSLGKISTRVAGGPPRGCELLGTILRRPDKRFGNYSYACPVTFNSAECPALVPVQVLWMSGQRTVGEARIEIRPPCQDRANG